MNKTTMSTEMTPAERITEQIAGMADWRGKPQARITSVFSILDGLHLDGERRYWIECKVMEKYISVI